MSTVAHPVLRSVSILAIVACVATPATQAGDRLIIHEWGTFTALQNHEGVALPGINIDDEPVPKFVHNLNPHVLASSYSLRHYQMKGAPARHPYVTLRLETPVIYFYPPDGESESLNIDVDVAMRGGWLTEFYPQAKASAPGIQSGRFEFGAIKPDTLGTLSWKNLRLGGNKSGPQTDEHVWTAPRNVAAASVTTPEGESERYLFYRGVGNFDAPLRVSRGEVSEGLSIRGNFGDVLSPGETVRIGPLWLVDIREDGSCAFRTIESTAVSADAAAVIATTPGTFEPNDYGSHNLQRLKTAMHQALVADGLYTDEATALLSTWQRAYFKSPGLRLFFLVPRQWTDHYLPLTLSQSAEVTRTMVGRIELISPMQQALLDRLSQMSVSKPDWVKQVLDSPGARKFLEGRSNFGELGVAIPPDYQAYLALGRFRNALVVAEERRNPGTSLTRFIETYGLEPFRVSSEPRAIRSSAQTSTRE